MDFVTSNVSQHSSSSSSSSASSSSSSSSSSTSSPLLCRDKFGHVSVLDYRRRSAVMCHFYLFQGSPHDLSRMVPSPDLLNLVPIEVNVAVSGHFHRNFSDTGVHSDHDDHDWMDSKHPSNEVNVNSTNHDDVNDTQLKDNQEGQQVSIDKVPLSRPQGRRDKMLLRSGAAAMSVLAAAAAAFSGDTLDPLDEEDFQFICRRLGVGDCSRWKECMR